MPVLEKAGSVARYVLNMKISTTEATGLAHAVAGVAPTFDRSLLPRTTIQQAGLTGLWGALNYGVTATMQSFIEAGARRVGAGNLKGPNSRRLAIMTADATALGVGLAVRRALPRKQDGPIVRAAARAVSWRFIMTGAAGLTALAADALTDTLSGNHDEQSVNALITVASGIGVSAGMTLWRSRRLIDTGVELDQFGDSVSETVGVQPIRATAVGVGVTTGLFILSRVERAVAHSIGRGISKAIPAAKPYEHPLGHATALTGLAIGVERLLALVYAKTEQAGVAVEPAYKERPTSPYVSGGSNSSEDWSTFGREGRRYVNMALPAADIETVTGKPAMNPIRAFVGLESDVSPNARAFRAMEELDRLGAFERDAIVVFFPTGTGYVNYVAAESVEYMTAGNVASVAIQYSVRPSFLSLDTVGTAWQSNLAFLTALAWRVRSLPEEARPRILLFGESLGSQGGQDVFTKEGTRGFRMLDIDSALFVGTPFASKWRQGWLREPEVVDPDGIVVEVNGIADFHRLAPEVQEQARIMLLTHTLDPIPKFGAPLIVQEPYWMGPPEGRPPGIPHETMYLPGLTFLQVAVDLLNAEHVVPGRFEAYGHDYRADIAEAVRTAYRFDVDDETMVRIETALRERELMWAERRLVSSEMASAEAKVRSTFESWGVDTGSVPNIVLPKRRVEADPYAAAPTDGSEGGGGSKPEAMVSGP